MSPCMSGACMLPAAPIVASAFQLARADAAAFMSGAAILIFVPTGIFHDAWRSAHGCGGAATSLLCQLPVTFAPTSAVAFIVGGRTYHETWPRAVAGIAFPLASHEASGAAIQIGRADAT